ncbi:hypothetical protein BCM02_105351 [Paenibacillus methanolicus]|uniref:Uncharacterized protein n=1 Tax=Paenibacillus methanolicus TaxID=582686 RepID=A0A5S5C639_9BACL|nr:hypothetical protein BCM02_105351 [Paenibacillus methanolicus]
MNAKQKRAYRPIGTRVFHVLRRGDTAGRLGVLLQPEAGTRMTTRVPSPAALCTSTPYRSPK